MDLYRLKVKIFSRKKGHRADGARAYRRGATVVAKAAYRRGEKQQKVPGDDRKPRNYSKKMGIAHTQVFAPAGAPDWAYDSARLWQQVELKERRRDAQLAREILSTLPRSVPLDRVLPELQEWIQEEVVALGMIADLAIHCYGTALDPKKKVQAKLIEEVRTSGIPIYPLQPGDLLRCMPPEQHHAYEFPDGRLLVYQPHAHIMVTMRSIGPSGFGPKERNWNSRSLLNRWRESWEQCYNGLLAAAGSPDRVTAKAKKKSHQEALAAHGIDPESPEAPPEPLRQLDLRGGIYAARDGRPPKQIYGDIPMHPFDWNERLRQLGREQAEAEKIKKKAVEQTKRWQGAWEKAEANALAQQQRAQDAEREKRLSEAKLEAEQTARLELEQGVETLTEQLAEPLGAAAPGNGSILERLRSAAVGVADLLRQETTRADEAEEEVGFLKRYLRGIFNWAKAKLPGERATLEKAELRIFGKPERAEQKIDTPDTLAQSDSGASAKTEHRAHNQSSAPAGPGNRASTEAYRKKSAAVGTLPWTLPKRPTAPTEGSEPLKPVEPRATQSPPVRKRVRDEHQR